MGEELLTITTEYDRFDKTNNRLDILAVDKKGKIVVIELKRDVADKFTDLQAIHYAAYCSNLTFKDVVEIRAEYTSKSEEDVEIEIRDFINNDDFSDFDNEPRMILVANEYKEETLASVLWLRDIGVNINCVKLEAYEVGEKIVIKPNIIIPLPEAKNFMMYREQKNKIKSIAESKSYSEEYHLKNTSEDVKELYHEIKEKILDLNPDIDINSKKFYIAFVKNSNFVYIALYKNQINLVLNLRKGELDDPKNRAHDVSEIGHRGNGDYRGIIRPGDDITYLIALIKQAYEKYS